MTPYRPTGRRTWIINVPQEQGGWRGLSTGTRHAATARRMQEMVSALGPQGARAWDVLAVVHEGTVTLAQLYDRWTDCRGDLLELRRRLDDADLEPLVERYLAAASCTDDTKAHYRSLLKRLIPPGKPYPASRLTTARVQQMIDDMSGASGTKRKAGAAVRSFSNWLVRRGVLVTNPVRDVRLPRPGAPRMLYLDVVEAVRLAEAQPSPFREMSALLAGSGIEVSVALGLRRRDVDVEHREIRAAGTKTHARDRIVRVAEWAWPYVLRLVEHRLPDARLFEAIQDRWSAGAVHRAAVKRLVDEFPVYAGYTMRDHRHTFAVRAMRAGAPPDLIARQLGHANATLLMSVYGRFRPSQDERAKWERAATEMDRAEHAQRQRAEQERQRTEEVG